jgi:hypothetical protein
MISRTDCWLPVSIWGLCEVIVWFGVAYGVQKLPQLQSPSGLETKNNNVWANWDGEWYANIAQQGYFFDRDKHSNVAFFPLLPLLGQSVSSLSGLDVAQSMVLVSNACLLVSFVLLSGYVRDRLGLTDSQDVAMVLLLFGLWPTTVFFRMAYSESLFVMLSLLVLFGARQRWPLTFLAAIAGLATATRSVGVALVPVVWLCVWKRDGTWLRKLLRIAALTPIAVWGLAGFMAYQWILFDDLLAFVHAQDRWAIRPNKPPVEHILGLLTLEPVRDVYDPNEVVYWGRREAEVGPLFSLGFANPIYFLGTGVVLSLGTIKRWLTVEESVFGLGLLLIPYCLHSYRIGMQGHGRMAAVVIPFYLVLGRLLLKLPTDTQVAVLAVLATLLFAYSGLFATWHRIF